MIKINKIKTWLFEKISKLDIPLATEPRKKREDTKSKCPNVGNKFKNAVCLHQWVHKTQGLKLPQGESTQGQSLSKTKHRGGKPPPAGRAQGQSLSKTRPRAGNSLLGTKMSKNIQRRKAATRQKHPSLASEKGALLGLRQGSSNLTLWRQQLLGCIAHREILSIWSLAPIYHCALILISNATHPTNPLLLTRTN